MAAKFVIAFAVVGAVSGFQIKRQAPVPNLEEYTGQFSKWQENLAGNFPTGSNFPSMPSNFPGMGGATPATSGAEPTKRQAPVPNLEEYTGQFSKWQENLAGNFPTGNGLPSMPSNFPGMGGASSSSSGSSSAAAPSKRQAPTIPSMPSGFEGYTGQISNWQNGITSQMGGNFPQMPNGLMPGGSAAESSSASSSSSATKRQAPVPNLEEYTGQFSKWQENLAGNFPTGNGLPSMPSNFPGMGGASSSSSGSSSAAAPSKRQAPTIPSMPSGFEEYTGQISNWQSGITSQMGNAHFPQMPSGFMPGGSSAESSSASASSSS